MRLGAWRLDVKDQEQRNTETWIDVNSTLAPSLPACLFVSLSLQSHEAPHVPRHLHSFHVYLFRMLEVSV